MGGREIGEEEGNYQTMTLSLFLISLNAVTQRRRGQGRGRSQVDTKEYVMQISWTVSAPSTMNIIINNTTTNTTTNITIMTAMVAWVKESSIPSSRRLSLTVITAMTMLTSMVKQLYPWLCLWARRCRAWAMAMLTMMALSLKTTVMVMVVMMPLTMTCLMQSGHPAPGLGYAVPYKLGPRSNCC